MSEIKRKYDGLKSAHQALADEVVELRKENEELRKPDKVMMESIAEGELEILALKSRIAELEGKLLEAGRAFTILGDQRDRYLKALERIQEYIAINDNPSLSVIDDIATKAMKEDV